MRKESSYQRLKRISEAKEKSLTNDIIALINNENQFEVSIIKAKWQVKLDMERVIWFGTTKIKPREP
jgi:ribosomal protein L17